MDETPSSQDRRWRWGIPALLVTAVVLVYANGSTDQYVGYNAVRSLRDNPSVHSLFPLARAMSLHLVGDSAAIDGGTLVRRPLLSLSFAVNAALLGPSPGGFFLGNLLVHSLATLLLFGLVRRTWADYSDGHSAALAAAAVALLWGVHPLHTESVTYVIQRAESQTALFLLASLYALRRSHAAASSPAWKVVSLAACAAAATTKENGAVAPLLLYLYDSVFLRPEPSAWRARRRFYCAAAATWALPAVLLLSTLADASIDFRQERIPGYLASQPAVWLEYLRLIFWPQPNCLYVNTGALSLTAGTLSAAAAGGAGVIVLLGLAYSVQALRQRRVRAFFGLAFALLLAPTSLIATNDVLQLHRTYLPSAIVVIGVVAGSMWLLAKLPRQLRRALAAGALLAALLPLGLATRARNAVYQEPHAVYCPTDRSMGLGALARHAQARGRFDEAEALLREILTLPDAGFGRGPESRRFHRGRALNDLAAALAAQQQYTAAESASREAQRTLYNLPNIRHNLAVLEAVQGRVEAARAALAEQAHAAPNPYVETSLGVLSRFAGDDAAASEHFERALAIEPNMEWAQRQRAPGAGPFKLVVSVVSGYDDPWLMPTLAAP